MSDDSGPAIEGNCRHCGGEYDTEIPTTTEDTRLIACRECSKVDVYVANRVPVEELQTLVEEWEEKAFENGSDLYAEGVCECADDLQERIDEYE